ncbi:MAG: hypothetical protein ACU0DT_13530 [Albimonas sp.]|uniref:hypothetical protein n=1 Tax=Albimonas sp. TaxID=1872425 RepID=UPI00405715A7|tara:strand:+ start:267 stop:476 length:210 start_codon:yes stop_codon:yes gene_type:complete
MDIAPFGQGNRVGRQCALGDRIGAFGDACLTLGDIKFAQDDERAPRRRISSRFANWASPGVSMTEFRLL